MGETADPALGELAETCFSHLVANPEQLAEFMGAAGYDGAQLRSALGSQSLQRGLVEYVATNEPLMLAICANSGVSPENFMAVWHRLNRTD